MKAIVHLKRSVAVEIPDSLVPTSSDRWNNNAARRLAVDLAMSMVEDDSWQKESGRFRGDYWSHPSLSWIEWPKDQGCDIGGLTWEQYTDTADTPPESKG